MIDTIDSRDFRAAVVTDPGDPAEAGQLAGDLTVMNLCVLEALLERFERGGYPFIDTKLSLVTGEDFPADDPVRGRSIIYGWIQGRGIEAMAGHLAWLRRGDWLAEGLKRSLETRIVAMLETVTESFQALRRGNNGRVFFTMTPEGRPLRMGPSGRFEPFEMAADAPVNFSDIFGCKALASAAEALDRPELLDEAARWRQILDRGLRDKRFESDQQPLDPANPATRPTPGRSTHGPMMLAVGAAERLLRATGRERCLEDGLFYIEHILANYTNADGRHANLKPYDMFEFIDEDGQPWIEDGGAIRCDGGHSCEFVGLSLKFIATAEAADAGERYAGRLAGAKAPMADLLAVNFANAFSARGLGMHKGVDLIGGGLLHPHMPWWPLPETIRAAVLAADAFTERRDEMLAIAAKAANAFFANFVRPELDLMARQTLDADGSVVDAIPATPDADPAYHTGLSIIDALDKLNAQGARP